MYVRFLAHMLSYLHKPEDTPILKIIIENASEILVWEWDCFLNNTNAQYLSSYSLHCIGKTILSTKTKDSQIQPFGGFGILSLFDERVPTEVRHAIRLWMIVVHGTNEPGYLETQSGENRGVLGPCRSS